MCFYVSVVQLIGTQAWKQPNDQLAAWPTLDLNSHKALIFICGTPVPQVESAKLRHIIHLIIAYFGCDSRPYQEGVQGQFLDLTSLFDIVTGHNNILPCYIILTWICMAMAMSVSSMYTDKWMLGAILRNGINQIFLLIQICLNTTSDHKLLGKFGCQLSSLVVKNTIEMQPMRKTNFFFKKKSTWFKNYFNEKFFTYCI